MDNNSMSRALVLVRGGRWEEAEGVYQAILAREGESAGEPPSGRA